MSKKELYDENKYTLEIVGDDIYATCIGDMSQYSGICRDSDFVGNRMECINFINDIHKDKKVYGLKKCKTNGRTMKYSIIGQNNEDSWHYRDGVPNDYDDSEGIEGLENAEKEYSQAIREDQKIEGMYHEIKMIDYDGKVIKSFQIDTL